MQTYKIQMHSQLASGLAFLPLNLKLASLFFFLKKKKEEGKEKKWKRKRKTFAYQRP